MSDYRIACGDDEQAIREIYHDAEVPREDGWVVLSRGQGADTPCPRGARAIARGSAERERMIGHCEPW